MKIINTVKEFIKLAKVGGYEINPKDAEMMLGYFEGHGYEIRISDAGVPYTGYWEEWDDDFMEVDFGEILNMVINWNDELIQYEENPVQLEVLKRDEMVLDKIYNQ